MYESIFSMWKNLYSISALAEHAGKILEHAQHANTFF
jgi:hypothetical protein